MDHISIGMLLFLAVSGFTAAFIDSIVGGGGVISLPALLLAGLPPGLALGTNKLAGTCSSLTSTLSFLKSGNIHLRLTSALFPLSFLGAALGAYTVRQIPSHFLRPVVVVLLIVMTIYTLRKKSWGTKAAFRGLTGKTAALLFPAAFAIGFYDGFFGPGTGSFLLFAFLLSGFDFVTAAGNAKMLNFASNIASLVTFFSLHSVSLSYGIPMGIMMIAGAWTGSRMAIRKGAAFVRPLFVIVTLLLVGKQAWDLISIWIKR